MDYLFTLLIICFDDQKYLVLIQLNLLIFSSMVYFSYLKKFFLSQDHKTISYTFFQKFESFAIHIRCSVYLELIFVSKLKDPFSFLTIWVSNCPSTIYRILLFHLSTGLAQSCSTFPYMFRSDAGLPVLFHWPAYLHIKITISDYSSFIITSLNIQKGKSPPHLGGNFFIKNVWIDFGTLPFVAPIQHTT